MNRWEVQFAPWLTAATVTAPSAADAIVLAASLWHRTYPDLTIPEPCRTTPHSIKWLGPAFAHPGVAGAPPPTDEQQLDPAPASPAAMWRGKCNICGEVINGDELETKHRHEEDPRSVYYVAPSAEGGPPPAAEPAPVPARVATAGCAPCQGSGWIPVGADAFNPTGRKTCEACGGTGTRPAAPEVVDPRSVRSGE